MKNIILVIFMLLSSLSANTVSEAIQNYKKNCDLGDADECLRFGLSYYMGRGIKKDIQKGTSYLKKACELGNTNSCVALSAAYLEGKRTPKKVQKAILLSKEACEAGNKEGCKLIVKLINIISAGANSVVDMGLYIDVNTKLIWQDNAEVKTIDRTWGNAKEHCSNLNLLGFSDWYLPSKEQLIKLHTIKPGLKNISPVWYWSSTEYSKDKLKAWYVNAQNAQTQYKLPKGFDEFDMAKLDTRPVRCVRNSKKNKKMKD